jgi:hypothetical protein
MGRAMPEVLGRSKNFIMWLEPFGRKKGPKLLAMVGCNGNVIRSAHIPRQISLQSGFARGGPYAACKQQLIRQQPPF